jgi:hypothetical protein
MERRSKAPQNLQDKKDKTTLVVEGPSKRNVVQQSLVERGGRGQGHHKNKQDFERGHARQPKHKGRGLEASESTFLDHNLISLEAISLMDSVTDYMWSLQRAYEEYAELSESARGTKYEQPAKDVHSSLKDLHKDLDSIFNQILATAATLKTKVEGVSSVMTGFERTYGKPEVLISALRSRRFRR